MSPLETIHGQKSSCILFIQNKLYETIDIWTILLFLFLQLKSANVQTSNLTIQIFKTKKIEKWHSLLHFNNYLLLRKLCTQYGPLISENFKKLYLLFRRNTYISEGFRLFSNNYELLQENSLVLVLVHRISLIDKYFLRFKSRNYYKLY